MKKILFYVEPHPFRNGFYELAGNCKRLIKAFCESCPRNYDFKVFSNPYILSDYLEKSGMSPNFLIWPTGQEAAIIQSQFGSWDQAHVNMRTNLVMGTGQLANFYYTCLERIYDEKYKFDGVVLWSDNGAVRKFCKERNIPACHVELGATREPFPQTVYLDPLGTNGFASVLRAPLDKLEPKMIVPRRVWPLRKTADNDSTAIPGLVDGPFTFNPDFKYRTYDYVVAPLQTADDLNTVLFSPFKSPAEFTKFVCEETRNSGLKVIFKEHPVASYTPFTLMRQLEAFNVAKEYDHTEVIEKKMSPMEYLATVLNSRAVVSINSSASFEASLLGKPAFNLGQSYYNIDGSYSLTQDWLEHNPCQVNERLDKLTSFLLCHYMLPDEEKRLGEYIYSYFDFMDENYNRDMGSVEYWQAWMERFDYGCAYISRCSTRTQLSPLPPVFNGQFVPVNAFISSLSINDNTVDMDFTFKSENQIRDIPIIQDHFYLILDVIHSTNDACVVSGWSMSKKEQIAPSFLCLTHNGKVIQTTVPSILRNDVLEAHDIVSPIKYGFQFSLTTKLSQPFSDYSVAAFTDGCACQIFRLTNGMQG